jgi:hypothetical protein
MEPRNIGVILWANGQIAARFLLKSEVAFVGDTEAYDWWISTWNDALAGDSIKPLRGPAVPKHDPSCMDALLTKQEENYLLVDAGELLEPIGKRELTDAVDFLFGDLVAQREAVDRTSVVSTKRSAALREYCQRVFKVTGIADRPDYHEGYRVQCPVYGVKKHLKFNHAIGNGDGIPTAVFQQTNLHIQQSVNSSALMLHSVTNSATVSKNRCAALARETDVLSESDEESVELLKAVCRIIFVDRKHADEEVVEVALNGASAVKRSKRT